MEIAQCQRYLKQFSQLYTVRSGLLNTNTNSNNIDHADIAAKISRFDALPCNIIMTAETPLLNQTTTTTTTRNNQE
eukprot:UN03976